MATLKNLTINDTGAITVPPGTTAERPTVANGQIRRNTTTGVVEMYSNGQWRTVSGSLGTAATGGSITTTGGFRIHSFTAVGAVNFNAPYTGQVEVLVVAGGGAGSGIGGGGGAGGYVYNSNFPINAGVNYTATVGVGGTGVFRGPRAENPGNPSSFVGAAGTITATGGGRGGRYPDVDEPIGNMSGGSGGGGPGGRGGAGTSFPSYPGEHPGGTGILGQGHPGGYGHHGTGPGFPNPGNSGGPTNHGGGGGGGAGGRGGSRYSNRVLCPGGSGITSTITGGSVNYATGGGGGTHIFPTSAGPSPGGNGIANGSGSSGVPATDGAAVGGRAGATNTGGGGGGGAHPGPGDIGGNGGPGIVVVRYRV
jgi:hypothetical protein